MKKLFAAAIALGLIGFAWWLIPGRHHDTWMKLPDGSSVRIIDVTYGTSNVYGSILAKATARMPMPVQEFMKRVFGQRVQLLRTAVVWGTPPTPELVVWVERRPNGVTAAIPRTSYYNAFLGDSSNFLSGSGAPLVSFSPAPQIDPLRFRAFPRRDRKINLNIFVHTNGGREEFCGRLSFANPEFRNYPVWQPESLPVTKQAGNVEVTLSGLETDHDVATSTYYLENRTEPTIFGKNRSGAENYTAVKLKLKPIGNTNEAWEALPSELSDATGNVVKNLGAMHDGGYSGFAFSSGLWPGEAAWKLKLALRRKDGFTPDEIFVFKNVPLLELNHTNSIGWTTNMGGLPVTLQTICRRAPLGENEWNYSKLSEVVFTHPALPPGMVMDLLRMVTDIGGTNHSFGSGISNAGNVTRNYRFRDVPLEAKTADFIFAVQQIRTVEFTVKPELPKASLEHTR